EQNISRVPHHAGKNRAELLADSLGSVRFSWFVERQQVWRSGGKLIRRDLALGKDILGDRDRCHRVRPARIEGKMRDDLGDFGGLDAVVERDVQVVSHLDRLVSCDQRSQRHDATVADTETGTLPYIAEQRAL